MVDMLVRLPVYVEKTVLAVGLGATPADTTVAETVEDTIIGNVEATVVDTVIGAMVKTVVGTE